MEQGRNFSLKILRINQSDEAVYECCAINQAGIGRAVVDLTVKELDVFRAAKTERIVLVDEGKDAFLAVDVVSEKVAVVWSKFGVDVSGNEGRYQLIESGNKRILKVSKAELEDQGKWKVRSGGKEVTVELQDRLKIPRVTLQ